MSVSVSGTGAGIPEEHLPQVFEPYFSTKETGTGIGLAIVGKAIEGHSGIIRIESRQGQGPASIVTPPAPEG